MPHPTARTPLERELHLAQTARAYLQGETQSAIAARRGVHQSTIARELQTIIARWRLLAAADIDAVKAAELARINHLETTYWAAWERSTGPQTEQRSSLDERDGETVKHSSLRTVARDGNPAYLAGIQWCVQKRCDLFGLDAAKKIDVSGGFLAYARDRARALGLDEALAVREAEQLLLEARS